MLFSPRFSPSAVLAPPPSFLPLLEPGNLSEKAQNKAAKEKRKQVKAVYQRRRTRRRRRRGRKSSSACRALHLITLLWLLLALLILCLWEEALALLFWMHMPFSSTGSHFSFLLQQCVWQELGKMPPGQNVLLLPVRFWPTSYVFTVIHLGFRGFYVAIWPLLWTSWTDTLDFPSPLFILWLVSLHKQGRVSCYGTKMRGKFLFGWCSSGSLG